MWLTLFHELSAFLTFKGKLPIEPPTFLFFGCNRVWTQGLTLTRQVFYYLSHAISLFASVIFQTESHAFVQVQSQTKILYLCLQSNCMHHHTQLVLWERISVSFCLDWSRTVILPSLPSKWLGLELCDTLPISIEPLEYKCGRIWKVYGLKQQTAFNCPQNMS
jgi:hypothetical protein